MVCNWYYLKFISQRTHIFIFSVRLIAEIDEVIGRKAELTNNDIAKLHFTSTVIKETLRLHPQAAMTKRATKDTELDGYFIPKDTVVMVSLSFFFFCSMY